MLMAFEVTESNVLGGKFLHAHIYQCIKQLLKSLAYKLYKLQFLQIKKKNTVSENTWVNVD